jgi:8-oxo-dGTP pyrophosphatase MutT (NUDIX family)
MSVTQLIEQTLEAYRPCNELEIADAQRLRRLLATTDVQSRSAPVHVTGSALVVHPPTREVLLRWHPRMEMWMQVGGHFDADEADPWLVAIREAREETGLTDLRAADGADPKRPLQIAIVPVPAHGHEPAHEHADFRYLLVTDTPTAAVPESTAARLRWTSLGAAIADSAQPNLRVFLSRVSEEIDARYPASVRGNQ